MRRPLIVPLLLALAACGCADEREAARFGRYWFSSETGPWMPEADLPKRPQQRPGMVIWELSRYPDAAATPEQQQAARDLIERCFESAERHGWFDFAQGERDGYELMYADDVHYANREFILDDALLDPERPEFLMYYPTPEGRKLAGLMFLVREPREQGPQIGGPLTVWHYHVWARPGCLMENLLLIGKADGTGACEAGVPSSRTPEMMHVWLLDHPGGPFATEMYLDAGVLPRLLAQRQAERGY